ncbi:unnamed protein product [Ambrosiozyma monospora]|uniref:Unnamed protein product n=1 Tax=Ambrosiozyma monospora TaxID=43982 RepID=A0ACB5T1F8_AMBMO|nr:unnamed protein product [Ambrosiozyma monospora]
MVLLTWILIVGFVEVWLDLLGIGWDFLTELNNVNCVFTGIYVKDSVKSRNSLSIVQLDSESVDIGYVDSSTEQSRVEKTQSLKIETLRGDSSEHQNSENQNRTAQCHFIDKKSTTHTLQVPTPNTLYNSFIHTINTPNTMIDEYLAHIDKNLRDPPSTRLVMTQLLVSIVLGGVAFLAFCIMRCRFPNIFMARLNSLNINANKTFMPPVLSPKSLFKWIPTVYRITEDEVVDYAGLDAFVFLGFFKMSIKLLGICWLFSMVIISPIRYYYTGAFDQGDDDDDRGDGDGNGDDGDGDGDGHNNGTDTIGGYFAIYKHKDRTDDPYAAYRTYLWVYVVFTYNN